MNIKHRLIQNFIKYIEHYVTDEFEWRLYPYENVDILVTYFRGFKLENTRIDRKFFLMDDKERWNNVIRLRRRIKVIKQPKDWRIFREIFNTNKKIKHDLKKVSAIGM